MTWPKAGAWAVYVLLVAVALSRHEPWLDEAQAWLIGRDATLPFTWLHLAHYEGSPVLWHTLLHFLSHAGLPYAALRVFSGAVASFGIFLLIRNAPLPAYLACILPFTYFLAYQYAVVARSYVLLPSLLFLCASLFPRREKRPWPFCLTLCLVAATSVHGWIVSAVIWATSKTRWEPVPADVLYVAVLGLVASLTWPTKDHAVISHAQANGLGSLNLSPWHAVQVSGVMLRESLTGSSAMSVFAVLLTVPLLWKGRTLLMFVLAAGGLGAFGAIVYSNRWHQGIVFLMWVTCLWMASYRVKPGKAVAAAILLVSATQIFWTFKTVQYDWNDNYSGSQAAAEKLLEWGVGKGTRVYALGLASVSIEPYFSRNIFANYQAGPGAYWNWSVSNTMNQAVARIPQEQPDLVVVAIKGEPEEVPWKASLERAGYVLAAHCTGALYWKTQPLEPESFDIYRLHQLSQSGQ